VSGPPVPHLPPPAFVVGTQPLGSLPLFDYWATIISQYANSPTLTTLITDFFQSTELNALVDLLYANEQDLDTAQGYGLDVWGRIVGVVRTINVGVAGKFLGFVEAGTVTSDPFNQSPFFAGAGSGAQNQSLPDASFRLLILAKALANITNSSIPSINKVLLTLFPGRGNAFVTDLGNMTLSYNFNFTLSAVELAIVSQQGVLPKPTGVASSIVIIPLLPSPSASTSLSTVLPPAQRIDLYHHRRPARTWIDPGRNVSGKNSQSQ
jgi:hypothetical protein